MSSPLCIGIDARAASHPQTGGFKAYAEGLLEGLVALESPHRYVLYVDRAWPASGLPPNFEVRVAPAGPRLVGAGFREQVTLPLGLARSRVDVAHYPYNTSPVWSPGKRVVTIHDLILLQPGAASAGSLHRRLMNAYSRLFLQWSARHAQAILTDSRFSAGELAARFPEAACKVHVVPLAANAVFRPAAPADAAQRAFEAYGLRPGFVLVIGSADPRKNVATAVRAYAALAPPAREGHGLVIVLAHADLQPDLERQCRELGLAADVTFLIGLSPPALQILYAAAAVFVFPSLYEGFGMPPLEAMACGAPVIASNASAIPEIVGEAALQVDPSAIRDLAAALEAVLGNAELAGQMRERGLRQAAGYSWANTARQTLAVYEQASTPRSSAGLQQSRPSGV